MLALVSVLLAAPVPDHLASAKAPTVRHTGTVERGGYVYLQFEITNPNVADLHYRGYTSDAIDAGPRMREIAPLYQVELKQDKEWKAHNLGWCKTGVGTVTIRAKTTAIFEASVPAGEWTEARIGVVWYTGPDRKTSDTAWGTITRQEATPKK